MCAYSLHHAASRPARLEDKLVVTKIRNSITREDPDPVRPSETSGSWRSKLKYLGPGHPGQGRMHAGTVAWHPNAKGARANGASDGRWQQHGLAVDADRDLRRIRGDLDRGSCQLA